MDPCPGEIYYASYKVGNERHRLIVVSRIELNRGNYVTVIPVTSQHAHKRAKFQNCVFFNRGSFGFDKDCVAQAEHIVTIKKSEVDFAARLGCLSQGKMRELVAAIGHVISANCTLCDD